MGHPYQKMPLKYLEETVTKYNAFSDREGERAIDGRGFGLGVAPFQDEHGTECELAGLAIEAIPRCP